MNFSFLKNTDLSSISNVLAVYYGRENTICVEPLAIYIPQLDGTWIPLRPDGNGGFKSFGLFSDLYYDTEIGFTFVASILLHIGGEYDGLRIKKVQFMKEGLDSMIEFELEAGRYFSIVSSDDSLTVLKS